MKGVVGMQTERQLEQYVPLTALSRPEHWLFCLCLLRFPMLERETILESTLENVEDIERSIVKQ